MDRLWFAACAVGSALILVPAPSAAQFASSPVNGSRISGPVQSMSHGVRVVRGTGGPQVRDRRRGQDVVVVGALGWNEGWALYNNRTFAPDSFNDWWHDRPDRSMPRWLSDNQRCERVWSSGAGWRC
ncbi:hypothetical protein [Sphingomonas arenae]|uniref:hypothetical protein n=1 Tax=Sphingomonas arenae TaxID=2812555 RepID=UPI0019689C51|nr:hypothetical protein [Sphingomonas arenae]